MTAISDDLAPYVKALLVELKVASSRLTLALSGGPTLLVEVVAWMHALDELVRRFTALDLPFEVLASTSVRAEREAPGQVLLTDLDGFRAPTDLSGMPAL